MMSEKRLTQGKSPLNILADVVLLSILFTISIIPVFTIGASLTALHIAVMSVLEGETDSGSKRFAEVFKAQIKRVTATWLCLLLAFALPGVLIAFCVKNSYVSWAKWSVIICTVLLCLLFMVSIYIFPLYACFNSKTKIIIKTALVMSVKYFTTTIALSMLMAAAALLLYFATLPTALVLALAGFGGLGFVYDKMMLRCFEPYRTPLYAEKNVEKEELQTIDIISMEGLDAAEEASDKTQDEGACSVPDEDVDNEADSEKDSEADGDDSTAKKDSEADGDDLTAKKDNEADGDDSTAKKDSEADGDDLTAKKDNEAYDDNSDTKTQSEPTDEEIAKRPIKKTIELSDALEDARKKADRLKKAKEDAERAEAMAADRAARETAKQLADRVKEGVTYETSGENVFRRNTTETLNRSAQKGNTKKQNKR